MKYFLLAYSSFLFLSISSFSFAQNIIEIAPDSEERAFSSFTQTANAVRGGVVLISNEGISAGIAQSAKQRNIPSLYHRTGETKLAGQMSEDTRFTFNQIQQAMSNNNSKGTGFFIAENLILTNSHVVGDSLSVRIHPAALTPNTSLETWIRGRVVWRIPRTNGYKRVNGNSDLALIELSQDAVESYEQKISQVGIEKYIFKSSGQELINAGQELATFSNPGVQPGQLSTGKVIQSNSVINFADQTRLIDLNNVTNGSSGAPIFDINGNLWGVIFAIVDNSISSEHSIQTKSTVFIPINIVSELLGVYPQVSNGYSVGLVLNSFSNLSRIDEDYVFQTMSEDLRPNWLSQIDYGQFSDRGSYVVIEPSVLTLIDGEPLNRGDIIVSVNGHDVYFDNTSSRYVFLLEVEGRRVSFEHYLLSVDPAELNFLFYRAEENELLSVRYEGLQALSQTHYNIFRDTVDFQRKEIPNLLINGIAFVDGINADHFKYSWREFNIDMKSFPDDKVVFSTFLDSWTINNSENKDELIAKHSYFSGLYQRYNFVELAVSNDSSIRDTLASFLNTYAQQELMAVPVFAITSFEGKEISNIDQLKVALQESIDEGKDFARVNIEVYKPANNLQLDLSVTEDEFILYIASPEEDSSDVESGLGLLFGGE